jgi:hypothetical protein
VVDIRDKERVAEAIREAADKFGGIDILINNASAIRNLRRFSTIFFQTFQTFQTFRPVPLYKMSCISYFGLPFSRFRNFRHFFTRGYKKRLKRLKRLARDARHRGLRPLARSLLKEPSGPLPSHRQEGPDQNICRQ